MFVFSDSMKKKMRGKNTHELMIGLSPEMHTLKTNWIKRFGIVLTSLGECIS